MLAISKLDIARHGPKDIVAVCLRQFLVERDLARRGIRFRDTDPTKVEAAYAAMTGEEFDAVNGRQDWANWRTIPRALNGRVPNRPLRVLDLGCGTGGSTRVLAFWCPPGSHVTGSDLTEPLLNVARRRDYRHQSGQAARVDFVCHGATETFRNADGSIIAPGTVDVVHASGVVGHHLTPSTVSPLINELHRVLSENGVALLDVGPTLPGPVLRDIMTDEGFTYFGHHRSWFGDATGEMVFTRAARRAARRERVLVPHRHRLDVPPTSKPARSRPKASGR